MPHKPTWMPWRYLAGGQIVGRDDKQVAYLAGRMNDGNADISGNMMAAAPELYQALEGLMYLEDLTDHRKDGRAFEAARAALAKARGERSCPLG